jgi:hypothetical protein
VGQADRAPPGGLEFGVARTVVLEGEPVRVELPAVQFDDEPRVRPVGVDLEVAHGVHPAVKAVKPAGDDHPVDRPRAHTRRQQLRARHHALLALGRQQPPRSGSATHSGVNSDHPARIPPRA